MNYYKLLQVDPSADPEVISAAYKRLAVKNHPDTNDSSPDAKARMQALNEAYAVLSDPLERVTYDRRMAAQISAQASAPPQPPPTPAAPNAPPPIASLLNAKSIGIYLAIAAVLIAVAVLGFKVGLLEIIFVLGVSLLLVQPVSAWLARRGRR